MRFVVLLSIVLALGLKAQDDPDTPGGEAIDLTGGDVGAPVPIPILDGPAARGAWVALSGARTHGRCDEYAWNQLGGPPLELIPDASKPARCWALLREAGRYRFELKVRRGEAWSGGTLLTFEVPAGEGQQDLAAAFAPAGAGERLALPGKGWRQWAGAEIALRYDAAKNETALRLLRAGFYLFERPGEPVLRRAFLVPPGKDEWVGDRRPVAKLTLPVDAYVGQRAALDGSLSSDPDGEALAPRWHCEDEGHGVRLKVLEGLKAELLALRAGVFRVTLSVSDGKLESETAETYVRFREPDGSLTTRATPEEIAELPTESGPLARPVRLMCFESHLDRAVQRFPTDCKLTLRIDPDFAAPEKLHEIPLHFGAERAPVYIFADWIARQSGGQYRREPGGGLWLINPRRWAKEEKLQNAVEAVDALFQEKDAADLMPLLREPFRGFLAERSDASLGLDKQSGKVVAFLPEAALVRLKEMLAQLRAPRGLGLPLPPLPDPRQYVLRQKLAETLVSVEWTGRRADRAIRDLSEQSKIPMALDPKAFGGPAKLPRMTLKLSGVPLRQALRDLVHLGGFDGCQMQRGSALWFYKGAEPFPNGELLWDSVAVRSYDLDALLAKLPMLSGEAIAHQIRRKVYPDSWKDPAAACAYHRLTGKLIVVHAAEAHDEIVRWLYDLSARGEDAMGPVLEAK